MEKSRGKKLWQALARQVSPDYIPISESMREAAIDFMLQDRHIEEIVAAPVTFEDVPLDSKVEMKLNTKNVYTFGREVFTEFITGDTLADMRGEVEKFQGELDSVVRRAVVEAHFGNFAHYVRMQLQQRDNGRG